MRENANIYKGQISKLRYRPVLNWVYSDYYQIQFLDIRVDPVNALINYDTKIYLQINLTLKGLFFCVDVLLHRKYCK
jgi:hypothetical protein